MGLNPIAQQLENARLLDQRRQVQIATQVDVINRLLDGETFTSVNEMMIEGIAKLTVERDEARRELAELRKK